MKPQMKPKQLHLNKRQSESSSALKDRFNHQKRLENAIGRNICFWNLNGVKQRGQLLGADPFTITIQLIDEDDLEQMPSETFIIFKHAILGFCVENKE